jgi:predicted transcriptional regulator
VAKKVQVVLDDDTYRLLKELAHPRAGNKSFVVREALRYFADREKIERALDGILGQSHVREEMEAGINALREGQLLPHETVTRGLRRRQKAR